MKVVHGERTFQKDGEVPVPGARRLKDKRRITLVPLGTMILESVHTRLIAGDVGGMDKFVQGLNTVRQTLSATLWRKYIAEQVRGHAALPLIHEEPFTRRAYEKPRGYAGDGPLLGLVYQTALRQERLSKLGRSLYEWALRQPACRSVNVRRDILANLIDEIGALSHGPRILSIVCGHLREAQRSAAVQARAISEFIALDQDAESLPIVDQEQGHLNVVPVRASIRRLLAAPTTFGTFDLAYAAVLTTTCLIPWQGNSRRRCSGRFGLVAYSS